MWMVPMYAHMHSPHMYIHAQTRAFMPPCAPTHTTCSHVHSRVCTHTSTCVCSAVHIPLCTVHTCMFTHVFAFMHTCTHTHDTCAHSHLTHGLQAQEVGSSSGGHTQGYSCPQRVFPDPLKPPQTLAVCHTTAPGGLRSLGGDTTWQAWDGLSPGQEQENHKWRAGQVPTRARLLSLRLTEAGSQTGGGPVVASQRAGRQGGRTTGRGSGWVRAQTGDHAGWASSGPRPGPPQGLWGAELKTGAAPLCSPPPQPSAPPPGAAGGGEPLLRKGPVLPRARGKGQGAWARP